MRKNKPNDKLIWASVIALLVVNSMLVNSKTADKAVVTNPGNLSSIPVTHVKVVGENQIHKVIL